MFQATIKNFSINFDALNDTNSVSSGDVLTGNISFDLSKETKITSILLGLNGKASVHWSRGTGRRSRRKHYSDKFNFFSLETTILEQNNAVDGASKLQPGTHVYPFTCQIPQGNFPSSFVGVSGKISYTLTVTIHRPWHLSKDFATELNFVSHVNTNHPEMWAPMSGYNTMTLCCLWCASGPIEIRATVEKKAFSPGETVKVVSNISNASSRTITPKVKLRQVQHFYVHSHAQEKHVDKDLVVKKGLPISGNTSDVLLETLVEIPPTASLTISNCSILQVEYQIVVGILGYISVYV